LGTLGNKAGKEIGGRGGSVEDGGSIEKKVLRLKKKDQTRNEPVGGGRERDSQAHENKGPVGSRLIPETWAIRKYCRFHFKLAEPGKATGKEKTLRKESCSGGLLCQ